METDELIEFIRQVRKLHIAEIKFKKIIIMKTEIKVEVEHKNGTNKITYVRKNKENSDGK